MKKPTLRMRQVFEGPTHFKVVKPLGNPIKIAKQGLSPNLLSRLRKYADGTPDEPVQPPTDEEMAIADQMRRARVPAGTEFPPTAGEGSFGVPELPTPDLEIPEPTPVAPVAVAPVAPVMAVPAAQPAVVAAPAAPVAAPAVATVATPVAAPAPVEPPKPTAEEIRKQRINEAMAAFEEQETKRIQAQQDVLDRFAQINQESKDYAQQRITEAQNVYRQRRAELAEFEREKPATGADIARSIGSAISVALGAFASGMTGMPNFAMKIYEDGLNRDLQRQREQRNSLVKQMEMAGLSVDDAEKLYRAQKDKEFAVRMEFAASTARNPKAREEAYKTAVTLAQKAAVDEADVQKKLAESYESTEKAKLATEQAKAIKPELELKEKREQRELDMAYLGEINKYLDRVSREKIEGAKVAADLEGIRKRYLIDKANLDVKKEGDKEVVPEMGAPLPDFLKGAKPEEIRKYRIEFNLPVRDKSGKMTEERTVGFLTDPKSRKIFLERSEGLSIAKRQAEELREWAKDHPGGLMSVLTKEGPSAVIRERDRLEALVKTMVEGYIKNVTGIRRASSAAIKYMEGVARNPSETSIGNFISQYMGGGEARFNEIVKEVDAGYDDLRDKYISGGAPRQESATLDRGITFGR
jgi:hypothetical protein